MPPQEGPKVQGNSPPGVSPPSATLGGEIRRVASVHSISPAMREGIVTIACLWFPSDFEAVRQLGDERRNRETIHNVAP